MTGFNFSERVRQVLASAVDEARQRQHDAVGTEHLLLGNHTYLGTEHLLIGLLQEAAGVGGQLLTHAGLSLAFARAETLRLLGPVEPHTQ